MGVTPAVTEPHISCGNLWLIEGKYMQHTTFDRCLLDRFLNVKQHGHWLNNGQLAAIRTAYGKLGCITMLF